MAESIPVPAHEDPKEITNSIGMKPALIPAGKVLMGSPPGDEDAGEAEKPQHEVEITTPFYLGQYAVTRGQFRQLVEDTGYKTDAEKDGLGGWGYEEATKSFKGPGYDSKHRAPEGPGTRYFWQDTGFAQTDEHPVVNVSWNDAQAFCDWLSRKEGKKYRLPSDVEWEYSCRAQTTSRYSSRDGADSLRQVANIADASFKKKYPEATWAAAWDDGYPFTAPVGKFQPNGFGLYDIHGNVWEWCQDWYDKNYYANSPRRDPEGPSAGLFRVFRGGSFDDDFGDCHSAYRSRRVPIDRRLNIGFRVVCVR